MAADSSAAAITVSLTPLALVLVFSILLRSSVAAPSSAGDGYSITGRVKIGDVASHGIGVSSKYSNAKITLNGGQKVAFIRADGFFTFARFPGKIQAALTENRKTLNELILEPLRVEQYYEIRQPFSIMALVKSPMGLMIGFMLLVMFVLPKLVENMDPEEIRKAQEEMRTNFLPRSRS